MEACKQLVSAHSAPHFSCTVFGIMPLVKDYFFGGGRGVGGGAFVRPYLQLHKVDIAWKVSSNEFIIARNLHQFTVQVV